MASSDSSRELQCVGRLEIARPKPVGFLCGSIPVPTDESFRGFSSELVPSSRIVSAPRYQMIPTETDLNSLPLLSSIPERVLPAVATQSRTEGDLSWESGSIRSSLSRKGEALAVSGLVEYGDEIDIIAPADILKQIFKIPYSRARLSIAVHRVGQTLILNTGPDVEEGEKLISRHSSQSKCADQSLFLNFAMHSVRMEACDCPPAHRSPGETSFSSVVSGRFECREDFSGSSDQSASGQASHLSPKDDDVSQDELSGNHPECSRAEQDKFLWRKRKNKGNKPQDTDKKVSQLKDKQRCSVKESEKYKRVRHDEFLRVLLWQFHNFRMLLGSDMLIFRNEKYLAVSLHLWDVSLPVTPITWLEAWLDNVMASVPELAICYHQDGVVQGYELLKTDDIFLLKGVSEDGIPAFHPHVVQQNGLSVLRFLQKNCKQDPGAYWLYKSAGEDVVQLFDLSVICKKHSTSDCDDSSNSLPSLIHRGRNDSLLSLGTLLYRIAHRLSLSLSPNSLARCVKFIKKCLNFLDEPDHLVVRAFAHEQFARLLLNYDEDLDLIEDSLPLECADVVADSEEESCELFSDILDLNVSEIVSSATSEGEPKDTWISKECESETSVRMNLCANISTPKVETDLKLVTDVHDSTEQKFVSQTSNDSDELYGDADPISSKLAAIHHVSQAIKSLRWKRQLQGTQQELDVGNGAPDSRLSSISLFGCACGDADCIEVCGIREWLLTSKLDDKLWKLVLLLGESYLALGECYKDVGQLQHALNALELACLIYGSMPQQLKDARFVSSMVSSKSTYADINGGRKMTRPRVDDGTDLNHSTNDGCITLEQLTSLYLFWAKAWALVGDVYVEFQMTSGKEISSVDRNPVRRELKMSPQVLKEVERLKKKLGYFNQNCSSCSLINCSCQSDRAHSGSSASSSSGDVRPLGYGMKHNKKSHNKGSPYLNTGISYCDGLRQKGRNNDLYDDGHLKHCEAKRANYIKEASNIEIDAAEDKALFGDSGEDNDVECHNGLFTTGKMSKTANRVRNGGIFKYLGNPIVRDIEYCLSVAINCYKEARKVLAGHPSGSVELQSIVKKIGWAGNELGRYWLKTKELEKAEISFADAISSFKEVSDHANIILINCNLGHGRRALAEELALNIEDVKKHVIFQNAYQQVLESIIIEYSESLRYYGAAKAELNSIAASDVDSVPLNLRNEVLTQFAHTYLKLGMLLAREDTVAQVYENGALEDFSVSSFQTTKKELRKHEISANDAIREALSIYESLGELRKQEAAYAYYQLACYQRDCSLKFVKSYQKKGNVSKGDNSILQRVKQYASLAERNWKKAMDFYGPNTHLFMYLSILIERSALPFNLSKFLHLNAMLEFALTCLLEGRFVSEETVSASLRSANPEICAEFWSQLQMTLKKMLATALSASPGKSHTNSQQTSPSNLSGDVGKLKELYKMSLKSTDFSHLHAMHHLLAS